MEAVNLVPDHPGGYAAESRAGENGENGENSRYFGEKYSYNTVSYYEQHVHNEGKYHP